MIKCSALSVVLFYFKKWCFVLKHGTKNNEFTNQKLVIPHKFLMHSHINSIFSQKLPNFLTQKHPESRKFKIEYHKNSNKKINLS